MFQEWAEAAGLPRKPLYRVADVAKATGIARSSLYDEIKSGRLKATRPTESGTASYLTPEWVDEWLEEGMKCR